MGTNVSIDVTIVAHRREVKRSNAVCDETVDLTNIGNDATNRPLAVVHDAPCLETFPRAFGFDNISIPTVTEPKKRICRPQDEG